MKHKLIYIACIIFAIALVMLSLMVCPIFNIKTIEINGIDNITEQQVKDTLSLNSTVNLFAFNTIKAKSLMKENPYVDTITFTRKLPSTLIINIKERKIRGYVPFTGSYLYIDDDGRVLDAKTSYTKKLPVVKGLNFQNFTLGEILQVDNQESFDAVVELSRLMVQYDILETVINVDVSKTDDIRIYTSNVTVTFGDFSNANDKISTLNEILKKLPENQKGFLDISDPEQNPRFTILT